MLQRICNISVHICHPLQQTDTHARVECRRRVHWREQRVREGGREAKLFEKRRNCIRDITTKGDGELARDEGRGLCKVCRV